MVRSVSNLNPSNVNRLLLMGNKRIAKKGISNNVTKHIDLPSKIALGFIGIYGTDMAIGDQKANDSFLMKCSEYEGCGDFDYPPCNPYP